jgi:hypothetical protein
MLSIIVLVVSVWGAFTTGSGCIVFAGTCTGFGGEAIALFFTGGFVVLVLATGGVVVFSFGGLSWKITYPLRTA